MYTCIIKLKDLSLYIIKYLNNMKYPVNVHYFDIIDSNAKAYILGFIAADGALVRGTSTSSTTLTITVKYEDRAVLYFIKNQLQDVNRKLLEIKRKSPFNSIKEIHHIRYAISKRSIINSNMASLKIKVYLWETY